MLFFGYGAACNGRTERGVSKGVNFEVTSYVKTLVLVVCVFIVASTAATDKPSLRIVEGFDCSPVQYPYFVLITINESLRESYKCGGTLVAPNYVLTAAHCCAEKNVERYSVQTGSVRIEGEYDYKVNVTDIFIHPHYNSTQYVYDACMLRLNAILCKSNTTDYSNFIFHDYTMFDIELKCPRVISIGFGTHYPNERKSRPQEVFPFPKNRLQCTLLKLLSNAECYDFWKHEFYRSTMLCAVDPTPRKSDVCYGDSGGPLLCNGILIGIVSFSRGCGYNYTPGVFTRASEIQNFVIAVLKGHDFQKIFMSLKSSASVIYYKLYFTLFFVVICFIY